MHLSESTAAARPKKGRGKTCSSFSVTTFDPLSESGRKESKSDRRLRRARRKEEATQHLFWIDGMAKTAGRVWQCGWGTFGKTVELRKSATGDGYLVGVKRCGNVWLCPECSDVICAKRKGELDVLMQWAREHNCAVVMLTLTWQHQSSDELHHLLDAGKRAKQALRRRRDWVEKVKPVFAGGVTATEVTFGVNGWHPHFHEILVLRQSAEEALATIETMRDGWLTSLKGVGLFGNDAAFQVQDASVAGDYVAKFGAADEMAMQNRKSGRRGGSTPMQLLDLSIDGDKEAGLAWREYAGVFKGRRQLVWSPGLKDRIGLDEKTDEALVEEEPQESVVVRTWASGGEAWREARRRRVSLVLAVEFGDDLDEAEFGPPDKVRYAMMMGEVKPPPESRGPNRYAGESRGG